MALGYAICTEMCESGVKIIITMTFQRVQKKAMHEIDENAENDAYRVFQGGSWLDYPGTCGSAFRTAYNPVSRNDFTGFRVVCWPQGLNLRDMTSPANRQQFERLMQ